MTAFSGTVYHGTGAKFDKFDQRKARIANDFYGGGVAYFTSSLPVSITYAKSMARTMKTGTPFVFTCELKLKKLFDVDHVFKGKELLAILPKDLDKFARGAGLYSGGKDKFTVQAQLELGQLSLTGDQVFKGLSNGMNATADARAHLTALGYDGLRYNGGVNMDMATKHDVYLAYHADSIHIVKIQAVKKKVAEGLLSFSAFMLAESEHSDDAVYYHASPNKFDHPHKGDVFLARDKAEAKRYGPHVYEVKFKGKPRFSTKTIVVAKHDQIHHFKHIEHNPDQKIYRT